MRRGLMGWDKAELPQATLDARVARLQEAMRRDGLDAYLLYSNLVRPSAVQWLTGFTPYWIESILMVGRVGAPVLATALSKRVADWIRTTASLGEIVNTPKPATAIAQRLAAAGCRRVGVLELDALPSVHYDEITAAGPSLALVDAGATFSGARRGLDDAERALIERADTLARAALDQIDATQAADAGALAGLVEKHARLAAAEEAYIAVAPNLDADRRLVRVSGPKPLGQRFAVRASIAYKGSWVRRTRSFARDKAARAAYADAQTWFDQASRALTADEPLSAQLAAHVATVSGAKLTNWMAESTVGSYPLEVVAGSRGGGHDVFSAGAFLVPSVELDLEGLAWLGAAPVFVGAA
jgi:hypothetical protein